MTQIAQGTKTTFKNIWEVFNQIWGTPVGKSAIVAIFTIFITITTTVGNALIFQSGAYDRLLQLEAESESYAAKIAVIEKYIDSNESYKEGLAEKLSTLSTGVTDLKSELRDINSYFRSLTLK